MTVIGLVHYRAFKKPLQLLDRSCTFIHQCIKSITIKKKLNLKLKNPGSIIYSTWKGLQIKCCVNVGPRWIKSTQVLLCYITHQSKIIITINLLKYRNICFFYPTLHSLFRTLLLNNSYRTSTDGAPIPESHQLGARKMATVENETLTSILLRQTQRDVPFNTRMFRTIGGIFRESGRKWRSHERSRDSSKIRDRCNWKLCFRY